MRSVDARDVEPFRIDTRREGDRVVVAPTGEIDLATSGQLHAALTEAFGSVEDVDLDLTDVTFIDSTGLRALLLAHQTAQEKGWMFTVSGANSAAKRLLELTGVAEVVRQPPPADG